MIRYIKQLLSSFNLPRCKVYNKDYDDEIYEIKNSSYLDGNYIYVNREDGVSKIDYRFGDKIDKITDNLTIDNNLYDVHTHEYLGDFLRFIRDYKKVDLMSLYNCFVSEVANLSSYPDKVDDISTLIELFSVNDQRHVTFVFPVKFLKEYTIATNWQGKLEVFCALYDQGNLLETELIDKTKRTYGGLTLKTPQKYTKLVDIFNNIDEPLSILDYIEDEDNLKMFIRVPVECKSQIVVLEGDYILNTQQKFTDNPLVPSTNALSITEDNIKSLSKLQLLQPCAGNTNLLADRLVEYLSLHAIYPLNDVEQNFININREFVEKKLVKKDDIVNTYKWSEEVQDAIDKIIVSSNLSHQDISESDMEILYEVFDLYNLDDKDRINNVPIYSLNDLLGYVDKDIEKILGGIKDGIQ